MLTLSWVKFWTSSYLPSSLRKSNLPLVGPLVIKKTTSREESKSVVSTKSCFLVIRASIPGKTDISSLIVSLRASCFIWTSNCCFLIEFKPSLSWTEKPPERQPNMKYFRNLPREDFIWTFSEFYCKSISKLSLYLCYGWNTEDIKIIIAEGSADLQFLI